MSTTSSFFDAEFQPYQPLGVGLEGHQLIYTIGSRTEAVECCIVIDKGLVTGVQSGDILVSVNGVSLINNNAFPDGQTLQCCRQLLMDNVHSIRNVRFLRVQRKSGPDQDVFDSTVVTLSPGEASLIFDEVKRMEYERRTREKSKVLLAQREKQQQQQQHSTLMGNNMGRNGSSNNHHHNHHIPNNNHHNYHQSPIPTLSSPPTSSSSSAAASAAYKKSIPDPRIENEVQQRVARESLRMDEELKRVKQDADAMKAQVEAMKRAALLAMAADEQEEHAYKNMKGMYRDDLVGGMMNPQKECSPSTSIAFPDPNYGTYNASSTLLSSVELMEGMMEKSQRERDQQRERERDVRERMERERYQRERSISTSSNTSTNPGILSGTGYGYSSGNGFHGIVEGGNTTAAMFAMEHAERELKNSRDRAISISSIQSDNSGRTEAIAAAIALEKATVRAMEEEAFRLAEQTRKAHMKREQLLEQQRRLDMVNAELMIKDRKDIVEEYADHRRLRERDDRDREHLRKQDELDREESIRERQELLQRTKREALRILRDQEERNELRQRQLAEQEEKNNHSNRELRDRIGRDHRREYDDEREVRDNRDRERERQDDRRYSKDNRTISATNSSQSNSNSLDQHREPWDREMNRIPLSSPSTNTTTGSNQRHSNNSSNGTSVTHPHPSTSPMVPRGTAALTFVDHDDDNGNHMHASQSQQQPQRSPPPISQQSQQPSPPINRQPSLSPLARMDLPPRPLAPPSSSYNPGMESSTRSGLVEPSDSESSIGLTPPVVPETITGPHVFQIMYGPPGPIGVTLYPFTLTTTHDDQLLSFYAAIVYESRGSPSIHRGDVIVSVNGAPLIAETSQVPRRSRDGAPDGDKHVEVVKNMIVSAAAPNRPRVFRFFRCASIDASQSIAHLSEEEALILLEGYQRP